MKILGKEVTNDSSNHLVDPFLLVGFAISVILFLVSYPSLSSLYCGLYLWSSILASTEKDIYPKICTSSKDLLN